MKLGIATALIVCIGCGKSTDKPEPKGESSKKPEETSPETPAKKAADPACAQKAKELGPWLGQLEDETRSHEIDFVYKLQPIDRTPKRVPQRLDAVEVKEKTISAFDITEHNHVGNEVAPTVAALTERLTKMHGIAAPADENADLPDDALRVDVDQRAPWETVAHVVEAAQKAGYTQIVFGFTGTSKLAPPAGVEPVTKTTEDHDKADKRLDALQAACKPWRSVIYKHAGRANQVDGKTMGDEFTAAFIECNCAADLDEVRRVAWQTTHWHQATPRVPVLVKLGDGATAVEAPAKAPWSEAHAKLLAAAADGAPPPTVKLVTK